MAACLRRFCWRPRIATVWSLCPTFKVTSLILMCRGYKPEALMCSPCTPKIPKAKVKQSPCTLLQSRKQKSIQLDQHTVQIQGKKLAPMCSPFIRTNNTKGKNKTVKYLDIFATNAPGRNQSGIQIEIKIRNKGLKQKKVQLYQHTVQIRS